MAMQHATRFLAIVNDAKSRIREITAPEVMKKIQQGEKFALIDVREDHEFAAGRLPHAQHISKGILERDIEKAVPDANAEIVLYCGGGFRSALAADNLQKMGYTRVRSLAEGWRGWTEASFPVEK